MNYLSRIKSNNNLTVVNTWYRNMVEELQLRILSQNSLRAASTSDFWIRVTGKEGVKKRWGLPLLIFVILVKDLNHNFTTFVKNSVWVFLYKNVLYRSATLSFPLNHRSQVSPGAVCVCPFLLYQSKNNIWVGGITLLGI